MDNPGNVIVGGMKPVAYLLLGYLIETTESVGQPEVWVNMKDIGMTLVNYVRRKSLPLNLTAGHMKAALLMLEGGYISIERDGREKGRNLEHPFKLRVNPSGRQLFVELSGEVGYAVTNITGAS